MKYPMLSRILAKSNSNAFIDAFKKYFESLSAKDLRENYQDDFNDQTYDVEDEEEAENKFARIMRGRFENNMHDLYMHGEFVGSKLKIKRALKVEDKEEFLFHLVNEVPLTGHKGVGIYWSWNDEGVGTYDEWKAGDAKETVIIEALVPITSVDIEGTVLANIRDVFGEQEKEITLKEGAPIEIVSFDGEKVPEPLKLTAGMYPTIAKILRT